VDKGYGLSLLACVATADGRASCAIDAGLSWLVLHDLADLLQGDLIGHRTKVREQPRWADIPMALPAVP